MGNSDRYKITTLATAAHKSEKQFCKELIAEHNGKMMKAAMSIGCYPNALRYWLSRPDDLREGKTA